MKLAGLVLVGLASGCIADAVTNPRRHQRQGRSQENALLSWEYGGWRPLQTPEGFYKRVSRNLHKDDKRWMLNEVGSDDDLEASSSSRLYQAQALKEFLKAGPECGGCGFLPMISDNRAKRQVRSAAPTQTIYSPQRIDSYQDDLISITDALKQKLLDRNISKRGKRSINDISSSATIPSTANEASDLTRNEVLDQAKIDKIREDENELLPKTILDSSIELKQAVASKGLPDSGVLPATSSSQTKTSNLPEKVSKNYSLSRETPLSDESLPSFGVASKTADHEQTFHTLAEERKEQEAKESPNVYTAETQGDAHFLSPASIYGILSNIAEAAHRASNREQTGIRSRTKRQIWNPFRRRQSTSKPSSGPFGFVNHNTPYEAQSSIDDFNFAQSIPPYHSGGFQGVQTFVAPPHPPPITNFNKVPQIEFRRPPLPSGFTPQFVPELEVIAPVPTRPVERPEQTLKTSVPSRQAIEDIIGRFQRTGQFPPDLSPETALLIAEILSEKKQNAPINPGIGIEAAAVDLPPAYVATPKPVFHRDPAPLPDFHTKSLASRPMSFGSLPVPPPKSLLHENPRTKIATTADTAQSSTSAGIAHHGHDGGQPNSEGFHRPYSTSSVTSRRRKKPSPPISGAKISQAEKVAEHSVEKDHPSSIFPQEHVHVHHHHKKKKKRPTVAPVSSPVSPADVLLAPREHTVKDVYEHPSHQTTYESSLKAKVHLDTKHSHGSGISVEAELGADTRPHPVTLDPLQTIDEAPSERPNTEHSEYHNEISNRKNAPDAQTTTVAPQWPVDDPFLNPTTSSEGPRTVGPEDILIQDARPGIPLMASDLNSLKSKAKTNDPVEGLPQPVFRPDVQTKKDSEAAKQANQDEDDISAGAGAIHFQPIQTTDGETSNSTGNAQLYHAYYAPAHHEPPPGYIRMTVDEFNKLFKDAEIQFIGSEQELQKKLGTKPTNKLNFDITKEEQDKEQDVLSVNDSVKESKDAK